MSEKELCQTAVAMLDRAYCPYSHFPVGAALECSDGTVRTAIGANLLEQIEGQRAEIGAAKQRDHAKIANRQHAGKRQRLSNRAFQRAQLNQPQAVETGDAE